MKRFGMHILLAFVLIATGGCDEEYFRQYWLEHFPGVPLPAELQPVEAQPEVLSLSSSTDSCPSLTSGTPRGLACLHCLHPNAAEQADTIINVLRESCLQNPAINYLVDGSFTFSLERLQNQLRKLMEGGRTPVLELYLTNGASQRNWEDTPVRSFATVISPESFREKILSDPDLQSRIQRQLMTILPVLRDVTNHGGQVILVPMLEDNLRQKEFEAFAALINETLPADLPYSIARNPCPNCYKGNDAGIPNGILAEAHRVTNPSALYDGILTNDGHDYRYESGDSGEVGLSDLESARDSSALQNNVFILWSGKRQGIVYDGRKAQYLAPDAREYVIPSYAEQQALIRFLQN